MKGTPENSGRRDFIQKIAAVGLASCISSTLVDAEKNLEQNIEKETLEKEFNFEIQSYKKAASAADMLITQILTKPELNSKISFKEVTTHFNIRVRYAADFLLRHLKSENNSYTFKSEILEVGAFTPYNLGMLRDEARFRDSEGKSK